MTQHFNVPVDRISRLLSILEDEIGLLGPKSQVKDFLLQEIKFTREKIEKNELFQESMGDDSGTNSKKQPHGRRSWIAGSIGTFAAELVQIKKKDIMNKLN